jgi:hypothetical protein
MTIDPVSNGDTGLAVRTKINAVIDFVNTSHSRLESTDLSVPDGETVDLPLPNMQTSITVVQLVDLSGSGTVKSVNLPIPPLDPDTQNTDLVPCILLVRGGVLENGDTVAFSIDGNADAVIYAFMQNLGIKNIVFNYDYSDIAFVWTNYGWRVWTELTNYNFDNDEVDGSKNLTASGGGHVELTSNGSDPVTGNGGSIWLNPGTNNGGIEGSHQGYVQIGNNGLQLPQVAPTSDEAFGAIWEDGLYLRRARSIIPFDRAWIRKGVTTVAALPLAADAGDGACMIVTDAISPVLGSTVVGGGSVRVGVNCDGSNWKVG